MPRSTKSAVLAPRECRIDRDRERGVWRAIPFIERHVLVLIAHLVTKYRVVPAQIAANRFRVGIKQYLIRIETQSIGRIIRTVDSIAVQLPRQNLGQVGMPDQIGLMAERNPACFLLSIDIVK